MWALVTAQVLHSELSDHAPLGVDHDQQGRAVRCALWGPHPKTTAADTLSQQSHLVWQTEICRLRAEAAAESRVSGCTGDREAACSGDLVGMAPVS